MLTITGAQMNMSGKKKKQPKAKNDTGMWIAPDGTVVSIPDMDYLLEKNRTSQAEWLRGYRKWKRSQAKP